DSEIRLSDIASLAKTSRAVRNRSSPCSVRIRPRAWRWNKGTLRLSSSALICRLTADWLRLSASPAWVKLPASATAWKTRSLSQSMGELMTMSLRRAAHAELGGGEEFFGFERSHAAHTRGCHGLAEAL